MDRGPNRNGNGRYVEAAIGTGIGLALDDLAPGIGAGIGGALVARRDEDG